MNYVKLVNSKLSIEEISDLVVSPRCGAISLFVGTTRDNFQNEKVLQLEYEAYEPMAVKSMAEICDAVRKKWPMVENIAIHHRLGIVPVKEASVVIAISSPHRLESLEAVGHTIEALKSSVPIWKKEVYESDKPAEWKENKELTSNLLKRIKTEVDSSSPSDCTIHSSQNIPVSNVAGFSGIDLKLVQIKADSAEIERRIQHFIERKREDVNLGNIRDFSTHNSTSLDEGFSCARVDALIVRRTDSKSHLRIHRVFNKWGPQTRGVDPGSIGYLNPRDPIVGQALATTKPTEAPCLSSVDERLRNAERHLKLNGPIPNDVYARIKQIEERILYLEGISPEYSAFWVNQAVANTGSPIKFTPRRKQRYTVDDLEIKIQRLQNKSVNK